MPRIDAFLQLAREQGCSDIHFTVGLPPWAGLDADLTQLKYRPISEEELTILLTEILPPALAERLDREGSVDLSYAHPGLGRFRFNLFRQRRGLGAICRVVPDKLPSLRE